MKLALAQTQPVTGNIEANVLTHIRVCERVLLLQITQMMQPKAL